MAMPLKIHSRSELRRIIQRFLLDKDRGISIALFADLAGISQSHIRDVFINESEPMTEFVQRRVSKAYQEWVDGEVAIMQNRDNTRFVQYRKNPKPVLERTNKLTLVNGEIKINLGIKPRYDYSALTLEEQLKGK